MILAECQGITASCVFWHHCDSHFYSNWDTISTSVCHTSHVIFVFHSNIIQALFKVFKVCNSVLDLIEVIRVAKYTYL